MTTVFVCNSYGDAQVYRGDTKEDVLAVLKLMSEMNEAVGEKPYDLEKMSARIDAIGVDEMRKRVNMTVYEIAQTSDDDRFDYGSGFFKVETLGE